MRIKIEINNKNIFLIEGWNRKEKSIQQKDKKRRRMKLQNIIYGKLRLRDVIENI
jgi:hypothetical protein